MSRRLSNESKEGNPSPMPPPQKAFRSLPLSSRIVPLASANVNANANANAEKTDPIVNNVTLSNVGRSADIIPLKPTRVFHSTSNGNSSDTLDLLLASPLEISRSNESQSNSSSGSLDGHLKPDVEIKHVDYENKVEPTRNEALNSIKLDEIITSTLESDHDNAQTLEHTDLDDHNELHPEPFPEINASTNLSDNVHGKIFSESSKENSSKATKTLMDVDVLIDSGSRSPSVLSSQDCSSKDSDEKEKEILKMKHLSFLLDQHHRRITGMGKVEDINVWGASSRSLDITTCSGDKSDTSPTKEDSALNKSMNSESTATSLKTKNDSSSSLFEKFDRTWMSVHSTSVLNDMDTSISLGVERLCFAALVHILLKVHSEGKNTASAFGSVSVEIVKLFWNKVILFNPTAERPQNATFDYADSIITCLTDKLRYIKLEITSDDRTMLSLSHEVYAQYARYIFECDGVTQQQIDEWNMDFVGELQDILLSNQNGTGEAISGVVIDYALTTLPAHLLHAMIPVMTNSNDTNPNQKALFEAKCISSIVVLLKDQNFLELRLETLASIDKDIQSSTALEKTLRMKGNAVLIATMLHVKDLEKIIFIIAKKTDHVVIGDEMFEITRAGVIMYNAWKDACICAMSEGRELAQSLYDGTSHGTQARKRRMKKSTTNPLMLSYSEACLTWKPKQFLPCVGEYEIDDTLSKVIILRNSSNILKAHKSKSRIFGIAAKEDRPMMPLSEVLNIDVDLLSFETCIGKALYLLGESLAAITASKSLILNRQTNRAVGMVLPGPMGCTSKLHFCAFALEQYIRIADVAGFMLSDELKDVDEDDLVDLGFNYEDTEGSDPSTRMKKLIKDRESATELMGQLDILIAESFFSLANHLISGNQLGQSDAIDMAGITLLNNLSQQSFTSFSHNQVTGEQRVKPSDLSKVLQCYQLSMHFLRLGMPELDEDAEDGSTLNVDPTSDSYDSELDIFKIHQRILHTSVLHAIGIHYYEHLGDFRKAKTILEDGVNKRQLLLRQLRQDENDTGNISSTSTGSTSMRSLRRGSSGLIDASRLSESSILSNRSSRRGGRRNPGKKKNKVRPQVICDNTSDPNYLLLGNGKNHNDCLEAIELDLSSTMEFSGLASHGLSDSEMALSLFQDALILRALHEGKNCLDVADLQYNMGVIHDDLGQYDASLGRYGESFRVRFSHLENLKIDYVPTNINPGIAGDIEDVERSAVLTLKCMANVYHSLGDHINAVNAILKAIELIKEQLIRRGCIDHDGLYSHKGSVLGFGKMKGDKSAVPLPKMVLEEARQALSQFSLPSPSKQLSTASRSGSLDDTNRNEISELYQTTVSLLDEMKTVGDTSGNMPSGYNSSTPSSRFFLNDHHAMTNLMGKLILNEEHVRLDSAFNLGLIAMYFGEHRDAISHLEQALRTLWLASPGDSSGEGSDSDASSSNISIDSSNTSVDSSTEMRKKPKKQYIEGRAEEGMLYHALAICHTALTDDERAIRCYITSLRYYRQRFGMHHIIVSGALYDCATSYWNLCDFDRAEDFWADCLRILLSQECGKAEVHQNTLEMDIARTLYNIAATKICKGEYFNQYSLTCLHDSLSIFKKKKKNVDRFSEEVAHAYFNLALVHYHRGVHILKGYHIAEDPKETEETSTDGINPKVHNHVEAFNLALSCVDDALNAYLSGEVTSLEIETRVEVGQNLHHPMQAHVSLLTGHINNALGSATQAAWNYKTAVRLLNKVYSPQNLYSASALYELGSLLIRIGDTQEALKYFEECLSIRLHILERRDACVADVLFKIGCILADMRKFNKALEIEKECLQIRIENEGNEGDGVATMCYNIGLIYSRMGNMKASLEYLEGAVRVRKSRIAKISLESLESQSDCSAHAIALSLEESQLASVLHHIGNDYLQMEEPSRAMHYYEEALSIWCKLCEFEQDTGFSEFANECGSAEKIETHKDYLRDMADTMHNMGGVFETRSEYAKALSMYNQALIIKRSVLSEKVIPKQTDPSTLDDFILSSKTLSSAITLLRIGAIHVVLQNYEVALSYYKSALAIQRQHLGREHISVAQTLYEIGIIVRHVLKDSPDMRAEDILGMEKAAVKYLKDSLAIAKIRYGSNHEIVASVMFDIGSIHDRKGDYEAALSCYQHSVRVYGVAYARGCCRDIFDSSHDNSTKFISVVEDNHGLFNPTALNGCITNLSFGTPLANAKRQMQLDQQGRSIGKGRDSYLKASLALTNAAAHSGILGTNSVEVAMLRFLHCIVYYGIDPVRESMRSTIEYIYSGASLQESLSGSTAVIVDTANTSPR